MGEQRRVVVLSVQESFPKDLIPQDKPWRMGVSDQVDLEEGDSSPVKRSNMGKGWEARENVLHSANGR